ncbi:hypothetical protein [Colwellia piezophila]|uniref:hypothetical protein n=1 Tax=Colwellia piezophila TaxID=211668 RepID=UPI00036AC4DC|nr:hypothetical protein [Colwellia piezophila]
MKYLLTWLGYCFSALLIVNLLIAEQCFAGALYTSFPEKIYPEEKYVFYSHGLIVEGDNLMPVDKRWGVYDFIAVRKALTDPQYNLISYHRPENTVADEFAEQLATDVRKLIMAGVKPENITLLGFSRGGEITLLASDKLRLDKINTILLAVCGGFVKGHQEYKAYGNVYSIYETSDFAGSCQFLKDRNNNIHSFQETSISTGKEHGAFYRPLAEWVVPVKAWLEQ